MIPVDRITGNPEFRYYGEKTWLNYIEATRN